MAFDAQPDAEVTARDRVLILREAFSCMNPRKFAMAHWECGTTACIGGWIDRLWPASDRRHSVSAGELIGLTDDQASDLFIMTPGKAYSDITPATVVAVLDHYLATGDIDWSVAG